jgi:demethylmenaquinone methyltransferase / 2-methoxy-6-polyprenyl-1,4-benzoquinol methylase
MTNAILPAQAEKAVVVEAMFDRIAGRYDLLNDLMTVGGHRLWKAATLRALYDRRGGPILDVATGTGDLALAFARRAPRAAVVGLDFSGEMLHRASERQRQAGGSPPLFLRGDALNLPFRSQSFAGIMSSFALRNVTDLGQLFRELYRVLARNGRVALLDLVPLPSPPPWTRLAQAHLRYVVPRLGALLAGDAPAYTYLPASVEMLPPLPRIEAMLCESGFTAVKHRLFGLSTVGLITATRP